MDIVVRKLGSLPSASRTGQRVVQESCVSLAFRTFAGPGCRSGGGNDLGRVQSILVQAFAPVFALFRAVCGRLELLGPVWSRLEPFGAVCGRLRPFAGRLRGLWRLLGAKRCVFTCFLDFHCSLALQRRRKRPGARPEHSCAGVCTRLCTFPRRLLSLARTRTRLEPFAGWFRKRT